MPSGAHLSQALFIGEEQELKIRNIKIYKIKMNGTATQKPCEKKKYHM